jgi:hypothetical protein
VYFGGKAPKIHKLLQSVRISLSKRFAYEGNHRQVASAFNRNSQLTLVFCTGSSLTTRTNFRLIRDEPTQKLDILIIDHNILIATKLALLGAGEKPPGCALAFVRIYGLVTHVLAPQDFGSLLN